MLVAHPGKPPAPAVFPEPSALNAHRTRFLQAWAALDRELLKRLPSQAVCFGIGEAAGLLRAYAPRAWDRIHACTADLVTTNFFGVLPVRPLDSLPEDTAVLVGVRPADQRKVAERLRARFASVTTWYDLIGPGSQGRI